MTPATNQKFGPSGKLILSPMLGPWDRYEAGSEQWAQALAMHIQVDYRRLQEDGGTKYLVKSIKEAVTATPPPWEVFPEEAKGNPETWIRMVTGETWSDVEAAVKRHDPGAWEPIAQFQGIWEGKKRIHGGDRKSNDFKCRDTTLDLCISDDSRGIRRRLQKRANRDDPLATQVLGRLSAGEISVNQAAIEAGMRQQYFRVPVTTDPTKIAASIRKHLSSEQIHALCEALLSTTN